MVIVVSMESTIEKFRKNISAEKIDMVHKELTRNLSIRIKYGAESSIVSQMLIFCQPAGLQHQHVVDDPPHFHPCRRARVIFQKCRI